MSMRISRTITAALAAISSARRWRHTLSGGILAAALTMPVAVYADVDDPVWWFGPAGFVSEHATTDDTYSRCSLVFFDKSKSALAYIRLSNTGSLAIVLTDDKPMLPGPMILNFRGVHSFNLEKTQRTNDGNGVFFAFPDAHVAQFITSFATASSMTVAVPGRPEFAFDLTGSRAAYGALANCTAKVAEEDASRKIRR
jgi:hypothetical protein